MSDRYICTECRKDFSMDSVNYYVEKHGFNDGVYEKMTCCPYCGGGYEQADVCEKCGRSFAETDEDFYIRWCRDCLLLMVNYDTFREYMVDGWKTAGDIAISEIECFFLRDIWDVNHYLLSRIDSYSSLACKRDLFALYDSYVAIEKAQNVDGNHHPFLDKIRAFVSDDLYVFAQWLDQKRKSVCEVEKQMS